MKFQPGDVILNDWFDEENPMKKGVIYKVTRRSYYLANLEGDTWRITKKSDHIRKVHEMFVLLPTSYYEKEK